MVIALIPQHAARMKPPRTLAVPFEPGRPLGVPGDEDLQLDVLRAALDLLARDDAEPVFEYYETDVETAGEAGEQWSCPVTFVSKTDEDTSWAVTIGQEISLLRPWYDKAVRERGRTTVGLSGLEIEAIPGFLSQFVNPSEDEEDQQFPEGMKLSDALKYAAEDLKAFYNEAATAQPGNATAKAVEQWYWNDTNAGRLVREINESCREHPDQLIQIIARYTLVPESQRHH